MQKLYMQLNGGLGNQLYIVASGLAISKKFGMQLVIESSIYNNYKLRKILFNKIFNDIIIEDKSLRLFNKSIFNIKSKFFIYIKEKNNGFDNEIFKKLEYKNPIFDYYLKGYFQSLVYFKNFIPDLKKEFRKNINYYNNELSTKRIKRILANSLVFHIRRKDKLHEINKRVYGIVSQEEIIRIINLHYDKKKYKYVFLVGDDNSFIKKIKKLCNKKFNVLDSTNLHEKKSIWTDFYILANCKGLILSNSSFCLWAGYLSNSKYIYYPEPIYPKPFHESLKSISKEDIIMNEWKKYKINYIY